VGQWLNTPFANQSQADAEAGRDVMLNQIGNSEASDRDYLTRLAIAAPETKETNK
jgi:hypothetical protein